MKTILFSFLIIFVSCGKDDFPDKSKLESLRILAITADLPEINTAQTVTLTPLISHVGGGDVTLDYTWSACPDPGIEFGADIDCTGTASSLLVEGSGTFDMSTLSASVYTGLMTSIGVAVPASAFVYLATTSSDIQYNGISYLFILTVTDPNTKESLTSLKRIVLSSKSNGDLNTNPSFDTIQYNGADLASFPAAKGNISLSTTSSAQTYSVETNVGLKSFSEDMTISWYASAGEYQYERTDVGESNEYSPSGTTGVFVGVYRDGRGGVATEILSF